MKITERNPARAECAATAVARLPVEAQDTVVKPKSRALVIATDTTRSLYDSVGWLTVSSLIYSFLMPSSAPSRFACNRGVKPENGPASGSPSTGSISRYRQRLCGRAEIAARE